MELGLGISIAPMATPPQHTSQFRIVCPAALVPVKGHATLMEALACLRKMGIPVRCEFYGSGPLQERLEALARTLGIDDAVAFAGFVPQAQLHAEYHAGRFAAMVLASRAEGEAMMEGLPSAVLEAMAYGVPVVATDSGSIGEVINGRTGHLVPPGDAYRLAAALADIYRHPQAARQRAEFAHEIVSQRHDVRTQMRALATAIEGKG
jgi:glycosyltransferase involved in cell wall biosynthesis